jgi:hypothetical protein
MVAEHANIPHKRRNNNYETLNNGNEAHRKIQLGHVPDELVRPEAFLTLSDFTLIKKTYNPRD